MREFTKTTTKEAVILYFEPITYIWSKIKKMFDFLKTEKNLKRLSKIFYYVVILAAICVIVGTALVFMIFFV